MNETYQQPGTFGTAHSDKLAKFSTILTSFQQVLPNGYQFILENQTFGGKLKILRLWRRSEKFLKRISLIKSLFRLQRLKPMNRTFFNRKYFLILTGRWHEIIVTPPPSRSDSTHHYMVNFDLSCFSKKRGQKLDALKLKISFERGDLR